MSEDVTPDSLDQVTAHQLGPPLWPQLKLAY